MKRYARMFANLFAAAALGAANSAATAADGLTGDAVKIGVIVDKSGVYSQNGGPGAVLAAEMAAEDFGGRVLGKPIEVLSADYQNKVDVAVATARRWFDAEGVDMIIESTDSAAAIAMQKLGADRKRITIAAGSGSSELTNKDCSPYGIHYVYDTYALSSGTARAVVKDGGDTWFFITVDYAFGHALERDAAKVVREMGGKVLGDARHPLSTLDFGSFLLQAQSSGAQVVAFANSGMDTINSVKQAVEFGLTPRQRLAALLVFITDIKGIGLPIAKGMLFTTAYDWNIDDETRAFGERFYAKFGAMPTMTQAGVYSAVHDYLTAIQAVGTDDGTRVMAQMKSVPINDFFARNGRIREDGLMVHDMYLMEAKTPSESHGEWDLAKLKAVIPGDEAFQPLSESACPLLKH